jgi:hypothetical protein
MSSRRWLNRTSKLRGIYYDLLSESFILRVGAEKLRQGQGFGEIQVMSLCRGCAQATARCESMSGSRSCARPAKRSDRCVTAQRGSSGEPGAAVSCDKPRRGYAAISRSKGRGKCFCSRAVLTLRAVYPHFVVNGTRTMRDYLFHRQCAQFL